jgi:molybdate transport system substrate-binding protein
MSRRLGALALVVAVVAFVIAAAVARSDRTRTASPTLTVYAAASLTDAFPKIAPSAKFSFAGSSTLATQIRQGAPADVFASANLTLPKALHKGGRCSKPVVFARNRLVVIVPKSNPAKIHSVYDLRKSGVKVVIAAPEVPVGSYTLRVLRKMNLAGAVLKNVVSKEADVREVLAKIALGEADAGFVYSTDAKTVPGKVRSVQIPDRAQPAVRYGICKVTASNKKAGAVAFIRKVLSKRGQTILRSYGFLPRVKSKPKG